MQITRALALAVLPAAAAMALAVPAWADSPHFLAAANTISADTGALTTSFKDAGLGTGTSSIAVTLTVGTATAVYQCWNDGGNHPQAGNKETVVTSLTTTGTFPVRNGQTTGALTVGPASPGGFSCPPGQSLFLQSASYAGIAVSDATGNSSPAAPDPIGTGPVHIPA
jgi:hypothetical protein